MRYRFFAVWLGLASSAGAQPAASVQAVVDSVRSAIQQNRSDSAEARALRRIRLVERLDDRTVETMESEGAGAETVAELRRMSEQSELLPTPVQTVIEEPPAPSPYEQERIWKAAGETALHYTESLPDFICTEVVKRYKDPEGKEAWHLDDTLTVKLTYFDHAEDYKLISINNRPTTLSYLETGGATSEGEFGSMLGSIFTPSSHTEYHWDHWTTLRKRPTMVYSFRILLVNSMYRMTFGTSSGYQKTTSAGQHGFVYVDRDNVTVMRVVADADIPSDFPVKRAASLLDYGYAIVGGQAYLLPLHAETRLDAMPLQHRNDVQFLDYKKFAADTKITFGDPVKK